MIELDGNYLEGGGSIVRVALALSTYTQKPFKVSNIRANRSEPGLKAQHLTAIKALKEISNAKYGPIALGDTELEFYPGKIKKGNYLIEIGTAGSISLLSQALILPCLFAPGKITLRITGGTCGRGQAPIDYLQNVFLPQLKKLVNKIELKIIKRGYYPQGGGEIILEIHPKKEVTIPRINLTEMGELEQIKGVVNYSLELAPNQVAERTAQTIRSELKKLNCPLDIQTEYSPSLSLGGEAVLWAKFSQNGKVDYNNPLILGADCLAEKGKKAEEVGAEASQKLIKIINQKEGIDPYLADQILMFMAILPGSKIRCTEITPHCLTNIYVIEKFLNVKFIISNNEITVLER